MSECSAVVRVGLVRECANGFDLTGPCLGTAGTPMCLKEELCGRLFASTGGKPQTLAERQEAGPAAPPRGEHD